MLTLTLADNGKSIEAQSGDSIIVRLDENPTTGFQWVVDKNDDEVLALQDSEYIRTPGLEIGGGGQRVLSFKARKPGTVLLQLKLWRSWEGDQSVAERFAVTIRVRG